MCTPSTIDMRSKRSVLWQLLSTDLSLRGTIRCRIICIMQALRLRILRFMSRAFFLDCIHAARQPDSTSCTLLRSR